MPIKNVVLLAAGRGSRLYPLTENIHKSLLPIAGVPAIKLIADAVLGFGEPEIVMVLGSRAEELRSFVEATYGDRIGFVHNERFAKDVNILSTELGVTALTAPGDGYLIVETDLVASPRAWEMIGAADAAASFWVTKGRYSRTLSGGALLADADGEVSRIVYAPAYDAEFEGWNKLLGMLYVGPGQAAADMRLRRSMIAETIETYYMTPWVNHIDELSCRALDLGSEFAASYNDEASYRAADVSLRDGK